MSLFARIALSADGLVALFRPTSLSSRFVAVLITVLMVNLSFPMTFGKWVGENWPEVINYKPEAKPVKSRLLSGREMKAMQGRFAKNPYVAGANKWSVNYKGVDLLTENFSTSGTDMTFEGGYGIPVNVTRSYSANEGDEGPLGVGWSLSVDVRSTAGGVLKSSSAPIRSVPVAFKERPTTQTIDPNAQLSNGSAFQPASAILATDAGGKEETEQRDVDGIITAPPWDKNTNNPTYEYITLGGTTFQVLTSNETVTPDGTTYTYAKEGSYQTTSGGTLVGGETSIDGTGTSEPSNVLKITKTTDRQGNVTNYVYGTSGLVSFVKSNGTTYEYPLLSINMPNGHQINFTWGNGTNAPTNRLRTADDNVSGGRTVTYGYDTSGNLATVTTPAGLTTTYAYGSATAAGGSVPTTGGDNVITSITDPRGLVTSIYYTVENATIAPYMVLMHAVKTWKIVAPNGIRTYYGTGSAPTPDDGTFAGLPNIFSAAFADVIPGSTTAYQQGVMNAGASGTVFTVSMDGIGGKSPFAVAGSGVWVKTYDARTQDLLDELHYTCPMNDGADTARVMTSTNNATAVDVAKTYNFMGNPLSVVTTESSSPYTSGYANTRVQTTDYGYWGGTKYFQQMGTKIQTGASAYRYTLTDYFDSSAAAGAKGQTKEVFSPAFTTFDITGSGAPSGTATGDLWKYYLHPASGYTTTAAAKFYDSSGTPAYDSKGRVTDVWKLQSTATTPWTYVRTNTTYGADSTPHWGQAYQVVEDSGSGHINRTTTTNGYTSWGTANDVTDAAGHRFYTDYDGDGKVNSVTRTDVTPNVTVVSYTYGTGKLSDSTPSATNGQPLTVTDGLSGVVQTVAYNSGTSSTFGNSNYLGGMGQVNSISEADPGSLTYGATYTYTVAGDRSVATYFKNSSETARWGYTDYESLGDPASPDRAFQTLVKLNTSNNVTPEEFHYSYDGSGRLLVAAFAQTPVSGYSPSTTTFGLTGASYYYADVAANRARAYYVYDAGGRMTALNYWWDTATSTTAYGTPTAIISNTCAYEVSTGTSNYNRGLKANSNIYYQSGSDVHSYSTTAAQADVYGYEANRDFLTSASYDGGSTTTSWSYDAAGNRNDASVCDNLNRATTIGAVSRSYDILGNTTAIGSTKSMGWDGINRMTSFTAGSNTTNYAYRADGMRVSKAVGTQTVTYGYDGQRGVEECLTDTGTSSNSYTSWNTMGARGIDRIETTNSSGTSAVFPIYDAHGNMVTTLSKSGAGYVYAACRLYDAYEAAAQAARQAAAFAQALGTYRMTSLALCTCGPDTTIRRQAGF